MSAPESVSWVALPVTARATVLFPLPKWSWMVPAKVDAPPLTVSVPAEAVLLLPTSCASAVAPVPTLSPPTWALKPARSSVPLAALLPRFTFPAVGKALANPSATVPLATVVPPV